MLKGEDSNYRNSHNNSRHACVKVFHVRSQSVSIYIREHEQESRTAFVLLRPEHLQKEILSRAFYALCCSVALYATRRRRRPTPINIDQAQQWPAGKRIDILYFPPALTGCLRADVDVLLNWDTDKLQDMLSSSRFYARRDANGRERYGG